MEGDQNHRMCPLNGHAETNKLMADFIRPDQPSKCTWTPNTDLKSPHNHKPLAPRPKTLPNILDAVGQTPLIKLNKIPQSAGLKCDVYAKCEFLSPGGSVKDRIGLRMIEEAEKNGSLQPGYTIIEPTSGNTGIGLALGAAVKGYRCVIVMPEKMSNEKVDTLRALGAEVIRTPTEAAFDSPEGLIAVSQRLQKEIPNSIVLDQYRNAGNPLAHYDGTGAEIVEQCGGKVDMVVMGAGTGGTCTGIGRKIKEACPDCIVVAADPEGSVLARPETLNETDVNFYEVEGVGYDFIPTVLDHSVVDRWMKFNDKDALPMARRLIREEGFLCGGSSGAAMSMALKAAQDLNEGQKCVVILPDNIRNYLSKFVSDNWMEARDFKASVNTHSHKWWNNEISTLNLKTATTVGVKTCVQDVLDNLKNSQIDQIPVVDDNGSIKGMATLQNLMGKLLNKSVKKTDPIEKALFKQFVKVESSSSIGHASRILEKDLFVLVVNRQKSKETVAGVLTQRDMMDYITNQE